MDNNTPFFTKIKRFADVSSAVGGLAARVIAEKTTPYTIDNDAYAASLKAALGSMKGPFMKVAQFLATIPDALPPEYAAAFLELQSNAPPMGAFFVKRRMQAELGPDWQNRFQSFDPTPCAAASLGQVHKATALDGTQLAVKLQYPSMDTVIDADLSQLSMLIGTYRLFNKALDLNEVIDEIRLRLREELDYHNEAKNMADYRAFFQNAHNPETHDLTYVPTVDESLSTNRLLAMSWVEGISILDAAETLTQDQRNSLGRTLFRAWYRPFYLNGWIHGDPHPGNYKVDKDLNLHLLDFGCVRRFDNDFVDGVIALYEALKENDRAKAKLAYQKWGFTDVSDALMDVMNEWAQLLYDPLLDNRVRPIQMGFSGTKGWDTATEVHRKLDSLGGLRVPKEFVFMDRASVGIGSVLMRLKCELNWHELFEEILVERQLSRVRQKT